ncbi:MAG: GNAT family N-acetyltransferase [Erysipelotrichales bacterium]|nr:GNAT family N-acetyltransferase [Erysipelotrichales bacterium]
MVLKIIEYGTNEYNKSLELRNKVMRKPLGFNLYDEDLSNEKDAVMIGAFENDMIIGVGVMTHDDTIYKVECLCIDFEVQHKGVGGRILENLEAKAKASGGKKMCLDARVSAEGFYHKHDYIGSGDTYLHEHAPVPHIAMEKNLI